MSMTKRYLESLPADEQDAILGGIDNAYVSPDEWTDDAENESVECDDCGTAFPASVLHNGICAGCCFRRPNYWEEEQAEWARALMEEEEES